MGTLKWAGVQLIATLAIGTASPLYSAGPQYSPASAVAQVSAQSSSGPAQHGALLARYCFTCHNEKLRTAELVLEKLDLEPVAERAETWEKVLRKLRSNAMPPAGAPQPDKAAMMALAAYLEEELDKSAAAAPDPGRGLIHRLNRAEYTNAVRDLLAVQIDAEKMLPADDAGHGFDNIAEILSVSPLLVERYIAAAGRIARQAVGEPATQPAERTYEVPEYRVQDDRMSENLPFGSRGGTAIRHYFPADGEYVVKVRLQENSDNYIRGLGEPHQLDVRVNGERMKLLTIGGEHKGVSGPIYSFINRDYKGSAEQEGYEFHADEALEARFPARAGNHLVQISFLKETVEPETILMPRLNFLDRADYKGGDPYVDEIIIAGPYQAKGATMTESRQKVFVCQPNSAGDEAACAKKILSSLARRAYRRPVNDTDIAPLLNLYRAGRQSGKFDDGIESALSGILVSTEFLFRLGHDPAGAVPQMPYRISDLDLASRLSFFLWSSIPDDELLDLAETGKLRAPGMIDRQVRRMLADPRSKALVENFAAQWLYLRNVRLARPDENAFPEFDETLREAMEQETAMFVESNLREDRSVLDLLDANYTYLNERLARHYGISHVYGSHFRRVPVTDEMRKGLLGQASVLTVTSYSARTAPTIRGKWVLDNLMGTPPPPPPPNVPSLKEENVRDGRVLTMRERLDQHRTNPVCASCHSRMDPLGFALENFDALGRWRSTEGGAPVDNTGLLPDGTKFQGPAELRKILLSRRELFVSNVAEKLLTYALGRAVEYFDQPAVRQITRQAERGDDRWSALITAIVESTPFQMRRAQQP